MTLPEQTSAPSVTYRYDFFSGANIGVWIGATLISEAVGIEFSLSQSKRPIWGWASQLYDAVSTGVVQCSGMLYLNFRQAHLFTSLIDNAHKAINGPETVTPLAGEGDIDEGYMMQEPVETVAAASYGLHDLTGGQINSLKQLYWGGMETDEAALINPYANQADIPTGLQPFSARPDTHAKGFDIHIMYGDFWGKRGNNTLRTLYNVHITGFGQTIEIDGKPVLEVYPFFCREAN